MKSASMMIGIGLVIMLSGWMESARASWHLWDIVEVYSSPDGTVQFVEFFNDFDFEHVGSTNNRRLESDANTFFFGADLPSFFTADQSVLVGTASYAALPGVPAPDYTVIDNFFDHTGDTIEIREGVSSLINGLTFTALDLPLDGTNSLHRPYGGGAFSTTVNSPKNFAGVTGTVVLPGGTPGDADGDGDVDLDDFNILTANYNAVVGGGASDGDFDESGVVDFDDFVIQVLNFASTPDDSVALLPEPATTALLTWGICCCLHRRVRRTE